MLDHQVNFSKLAVGANMANLNALDAVVLHRDTSYFADDIRARQSNIAEMVTNARILVVGGGGTIGSATCKLLAAHAPAALHVVDQSENYLAELVRELRGRSEGLNVADFRTYPLDYGSPVMGRFLRESKPYDIVLNFAALKHVRSEKDVYSLLQMLDTNIVRHIRFKKWLAEFGHGKRFFAVSTDKAANPKSLMGASKRLMEDVVFGIANRPDGASTSARFANVAFSNGSLLQGFLYRLEKRQPLAAPRDTRRFFVSQRESGEICLLGALVAPDRHIVFPRLSPADHLQLLDEIACRVLKHVGLIPEYYDNEDAAKCDVEAMAAKGRWPLLLTPLDTSGEKPYEEFVGQGEEVTEIGMSALCAIRHVQSADANQILFDKLEEYVEDPSVFVNKSLLTEAISEILANFFHTETGKNLDDRL
jgi:FlaA1/EpsC-like NDP-sugar epimerase